MRTLLSLVSGLVAMAGILAGCAMSPAADGEGRGDDARPPVRIASLKGPTTMGLVTLMSDAERGATRLDYRVTVHGSPDEIVPGLAKGDIDIALLPANLAAVLYNKTQRQVQMAAINTLGVLYVVETGDTIRSMEDLRGRTVYSTGKGTSPEYVLNHLLARNGMDPMVDLRVEYKSESTEVAVLLASADDAIAVLPEPFVTIVQSQNPAVRVALDLTREWEKVSPDSTVVTGVVLVRKAYAEAERESFATFLDDYRASVAATNEHPAEAGQLIADYGIVPAATIAEKAIPACNITYIDGNRMKALASGYLRVLFDANPASVGGAMPDDDFYYQP